MNNYQYILFDFDGTIFDTSEGIYKSFDKVVDYYKLNVPDKSVYNTMIGPPLRESFSRVFKIPEEKLIEAMGVYRKYYSASGMFEVQVYDGIIPLINVLRKQGKAVCVATSKPEIYAKQILERQNMLGLFDFVAGSDMEEARRVNKVDVIRYVLDEMGLNDKKDECVLIGDTHFDVVGAKAAGIDCIGILYGFGSRQELESYGATYIKKTPYDVQKFLCS
ncbi:MAG: HAD hydrolase-like protein [Treponema sp.]|nr:HAD hydrolase-like protein [Treponema sp.]